MSTSSISTDRQLFFGTEAPLKILLKIAPPVMLAQLIQALYNIVDSYYVGKYSDAGLTALSIIFPLQLLITAICVGTGVGVNTVMAKLYGLKEFRRAEAVAGVGTLLIILSWLIFALLSFFWMPAYVRLSTDSPAVIADAVLYGKIVCVGSLGIFCEGVWTKVHQAGGNMKIPMAAQICGALLNIVLDPVLIFGFAGIPPMGIAGAAVATVLGQVTAAIITGIHGFRAPPPLSSARRYIPQIYRAGLPSILMQMLYTVYIVGLNIILSAFSDSAVTVLGLYYKLQTFFFIPLIGLQTCIIPVLSFNYATGERNRCRQVLLESVCIALIFISIGVVAFEGFPVFLIRLFSRDPEAAQIGRIAFRLIGLSFFPAVPAWMLPVFFQAIGHSLKSILLILLRQIVLLVPGGHCPFSVWIISG